MRLQKKIILLFLPTIFLSITLFGLWAGKSTEKELRNTVSLYLEGVITTYISENVQAQYELLVRNGLDAIPSYVSRYQHSALAGLATIKLLWPGHFFVLSKDGEMIMCTLEHENASMTQSWWRLIESQHFDTGDAKTATGYHTSEHADEFYCLSFFAPWGWYIGVAVSADTIYDAVIQIRFGTLFFALLSGVIILLTSLVLLKKVLLHPIGRITEATKEITRGHYPQQIAVHNSDELGELARNVMHMSRTIEEKTAELLDLNRMLEQKVIKRTEELNQKNRSLALEIEDRKKIEEKLRQKTRELEQSNRDLQDFAYVASHDLQEPLRMVSSFTQLLAKRYGDRLDENAKKYIWYAADGASRMQQLIQDLLQFSRITTQGDVFSSVDSGMLVQQAVHNLQALILESKARIIYQDLPAVIADGGQLRQVFQNLIGNGIKFRGDSIPQVEITAENQEDHWVFCVSDNGIGIDPQYHDKIFTIFKRLHTREEYTGTGIGLALCKRIIERHDGRIWMISEPGKGTSFYFTLKAVQLGHQ